MRRSPHSFTLLEVMVVVTLLGLIAGYVFRGVFDTAESPKHSLRRFAMIDAEARLLARRKGPVSLLIENKGRDSIAELVLMYDGTTRRFDIDARLDLQCPTGPVSRLEVDRHGQSDDYRVSVGDATHELHVAGLTGWTWISDD